MDNVCIEVLKDASCQGWFSCAFWRNLGKMSRGKVTFLVACWPFNSFVRVVNQPFEGLYSCKSSLFHVLMTLIFTQSLTTLILRKKDDFWKSVGGSSSARNLGNNWLMGLKAKFYYQT